MQNSKKENELKHDFPCKCEWGLFDNSVSFSQKEGIVFPLAEINL